MYEGLGQTYINVFLQLTAAAFLVAIVVGVGVRVTAKLHIVWCVLLTVVLGIVFAYGANSLLHHDMFVRRHQNRNLTVPSSGCITYQPSFGRLYASYKISKKEFTDWVATHPWKLREYDLGLIEYDSKMLNFKEPELAYATEMAANGGQLRVYFKNDIMYLSYNVM